MKCSAKNKAGKPCNAPAAGGTKYCVMHSGRAAELGSKGGRRRAIYTLGDTIEIPAPKAVSDLVGLLAQSIVEVRSGKLEPKTANAITYLATGLLRAIEGSESEKRQANPERGHPPGAFASQIYEAKWLREKKAQWDAELENKYADRFPPRGNSPGGQA
jgi:hypothetical protein